MVSKFSLRNSIFSPHLAAMSLARSNSTPLLILSGSVSPAVEPQKFGPGRLVTTDSTPAFTGLQSTVAPPAAAVLDAPPAALVGVDSFFSLPQDDSTRPAATKPAAKRLTS